MTGLADASDRVLPFSVPELDVRGRVVELGPAIDAILSRHDYPEPVARLLAQAIALTALLGSSLKFDGKLIVQAQTDGPVNLIVADYRAGGFLRGYARFDADEVAASEGEDDFALLGAGVLALTIDQGPRMQTYQGLVALDGVSFEQAAKAYFRQSEQLPTEVRLAVARIATARDEGGFDTGWRAGGIIAQFMPEAPERIGRVDLPGGDGADDTVEAAIDDAWAEAQVLVGSTEDQELTDPQVGAERLLYRLFHEQGARAFEPQALYDKCSCSRERVQDIVENMSAEEQAESTESDGRIHVTCQFCSTHYEFVTDAL